MKIISGMHRSGTSLIARLFHEAGADMGDPDTFYRPDKWNPDGYFEQPAIHEVNMPLIRGRWWKFSYFMLPSEKTILKRARKLAGRIRETAACFEGKVVKEARFCLTLPAWLAYGAHIDRILVCLRDPIHVAGSLQKRNRISVRRALGLWSLHNSRLLESAKGIDLWFVYYRNVLSQELYFHEMGSAFRFFGYNFSDDELGALRTKCVKPQMNHHQQQSFSYPPDVQKLWDELLNRHESQFDRIPFDQIGSRNG